MDTPLTERLQNYISSMAPHQKVRLGGKLMAEALAEIKRLEKELESRLPTVEDIQKIYEQNAPKHSS